MEDRSTVLDRGRWVIPLSVLAAGLFLLFGVFLGTHGIRNVAIEKGHAEWFLRDGSAEWRWKECPTCVGEKKAGDAK